MARRRKQREQRPLFDDVTGEPSGFSEAGCTRQSEGAGDGPCAGLPKLYCARFPLLQQFFFKVMQMYRQQDPLGRLLVFVPTSFCRAYLQRELVKRGVTLCSVHFFTLDGFVHRVYGEVAESGPVPLSPAAAPLVVAEVAEDVLKGTYFDRVREMHGFQHALLATVLDLKEACLTADELDALEIPDSGDRLREKLDALVAFWRGYEERCRQLGVADLPDLYRAVIDRIDAIPLVRQASACLVYGFYDFKGVQYRLVRALACRKYTVFFAPVVTTSPAYEYAADAIETLTSDLRCVEQDVPLEDSHDGESAALRALQRELFHDTEGYAPESDDRSVRLISLPTDAREPDAVTRLVADALGAEQQEPHRIAVVGRAATQLIPYIAALKTHDITVCDGGLFPLSATQVGFILSLLLDLVAEGDEARRYPRDEVLRLLEAASGVIEGQRNAHAFDWIEHLASFDMVTRYAAIVSGREQWLKGLEKLEKTVSRKAGTAGAGEVPEVSPESVRVLRSLVGCLFASLDKLANASDWDSAVGALGQVFLTLFGEDVWIPAPLKALLQALKEMSRFAEKFRLSLFLACARELADALPGAEESPRFMEGGVVVCDVMSIRGARFDTVIMPGVVERQFPLAYREDPILLDQDRERINAALQGRPPLLKLPLRRRRPLEERLLFKLAIDSADRAVRFTFPRLETGSARPVLPSPYILDVLRVLGVNTPGYRALSERQPLPCVEYVTSRTSEPERWALGKRQFLRDTVVRAVTRAAAGESIATAPWKAAARVCEVLKRALRAERRKWGKREYTEFDGWLSDSRLQASIIDALLHEQRLTVSMLDDYASCPYAFLLRHVLGLDAEPDPVREYGVPPTLIGQLAHEILAQTFGGFAAPPEEEQILEELGKCASEVFAKAEGRFPIGYPVLWEVEKRRLLRSLEGLVRYELGRLRKDAQNRWVWKCEVPVETQRPVTLSDGQIANVAIQGRIDRIDRADGGGWAIVDYKRRRSSTTTIQLAAYAIAAHEQFPEELPAERFTGMEYCYYQEPTRKSLHSSQDASLAQVQADIEEATNRLVQGAQGGDFRQNADSNTCPPCNFAEICMERQFLLQRIKGESPEEGRNAGPDTGDSKGDEERKRG